MSELAGNQSKSEPWPQRWGAMLSGLNRWCKHWLRLSLWQSLRLLGWVGAGTAVCGALAIYLSQAHEHALEDQLGRLAGERLKLLRSSTHRSLETLHLLAAYLRVSENTSRAEFQAFVDGPLARLPELRALEWIPRVPHTERDAYETRAHTEGYPDFRFTELDDAGNAHPAERREEYFPVFYVEPLSPNLPALGLDLSSHFLRRSALELSRMTGELVATEPIRLAQETEPGELGFLVFAPVIKQQQFLGFALAVFRLRNLLEPSLSPGLAQGLAVTIVDTTDPAHPLFTLGNSAPDSTLVHSDRMELAGRAWDVVFRPTAAFKKRYADTRPVIYPLVGFLLVLVSAAYSVKSMHHTLDVEQRTTELFHANERLHAEIGIRKKAQEEAASARHAQTLFLANMSHEIRTPLNAIIGYSQVLQRRVTSDPLQHEALETMAQSANYLLTLVGEVLDLSKIEAGGVELEPSDFNLGAMVSGLALMFRHKCDQKGLRLRIEGLGASPLWVRGDEAKLKQVLINLLGNAVKFTERGEVRLRVVPEEGNTVRFEVIDTGVGIEAEQHDRVFGDFFQANTRERAEGAGLGLAISRRLVEAMGGELLLRSTPGWGSDFYFGLTFAAPLAVVASEAKTALPRIRLATETPCRALVVDDLESNRSILRHMLSAIGCEVEAAASGPEALQRFATLQPDIVFLDFLMPGMDGIQTTLALRKLDGGERAQVVAFSASALDSQREQYLAAGFDDFIAKPFRMERVNECLARLLRVRFVAESEPLAHAPRSTVAHVPESLRQQIQQAAELYQTTRLRLAFEQLDLLGPEQRRLAEYLRSCVQVYDMVSITNAVAGAESTPALVPSAALLPASEPKEHADA